MGREEVGAGESDASLFAADDAKGEVAVAGDGCEEEVGAQCDGADCQRACDGGADPSMKVCRGFLGEVRVRSWHDERVVKSNPEHGKGY